MGKVTQKQIEAIFHDQDAMRLLGVHPNLIDTGDMFAWDDNKFVLPTEFVENGRPLEVLLLEQGVLTRETLKEALDEVWGAAGDSGPKPTISTPPPRIDPRSGRSYPEARRPWSWWAVSVLPSALQPGGAG